MLGCLGQLGEHDQGLALLWSRWLLFVELGRFVNNTVIYVSVCMPIGTCPLGIYVCVFAVCVFVVCVC